MLRTPLRRSEWLSDLAGGDVYLKLETLQPTFSFKIRGAFNAVLRLAEQGSGATPLVTASAGNHGRALGHAAREAGLSLTVYAPAAAPRVKLEAIRRTGATLVACTDYDEAERRAKEHGAAGRALFVSPYAQADVIAGAGTVALEIVEDEPRTDTIVAPVGGGGLIAGIAAAVASAPGGPRVLGVEAAASPPFTRSLAAGHIVHIDVGPTIADGLAGNLDPETPTFEMVRRLASGIAVVSEDQIEKAISGVVKEERLVAEGAGAVAVAAVLAGRVDLRGRRTAVVLSGANIDDARLRALI